MINSKNKFWGWGNVNVNPPITFVENTLELLSIGLGQKFNKRQVEFNIADIRLSDSRISVSAAISSFTVNFAEDRIHHTYGQAFRDVIRALSGDFSCAPDLVSYPKNEEELCEIMNYAVREGARIVPYGGGTSVCGGIEYRGIDMPIICVDLKYFNAIHLVNKTDLTARIGAGILGPDLENGLKPHGLTLRHFPQSFEFSTLGGWIATRSGGHFATRFTQIDEFVQNIRMVSPSGTIETPQFPNSGAGPDMNRLISGSEGIMGIITQATMRLQKIPKNKLTQTIQFKNFHDGVDACRHLAQSALFPSNARLIGPLEALGMRLGDGIHSVLILGFEFHDVDPQPFMTEAVNICKKHRGIITKSKNDHSKDTNSDKWKSSFLMAPYLRDELILHGLIVETFETCVTWDRFDDLYSSIMVELKEYAIQLCGSAYITCRFTHLYPDGPAPYFTVMANGLNLDRLEIWDKIKTKANDILLRQGATITHHHAVGRDHQKHYENENEMGVGVLKSLKNHFDPKGIMNPGVLIPTDPNVPQKL